MTTTKKDPVLVVVQLTGANDAMNTVIPYGDPLYYDNRPTVGIPQDQVLPIDDHHLVITTGRRIIVVHNPEQCRSVRRYHQRAEIENGKRAVKQLAQRSAYTC